MFRTYGTKKCKSCLEILEAENYSFVSMGVNSATFFPFISYTHGLLPYNLIVETISFYCITQLLILEILTDCNFSIMLHQVYKQLLNMKWKRRICYSFEAAFLFPVIWCFLKILLMVDLEKMSPEIILFVFLGGGTW